jgi:hypothetical protein
MKRLTTNCPDNNLDAALNLFYIKDGEAWVRGGGDGPDYPDIRLYDFIRKAAKILLPDLDFPMDDDGVDYAMGELLLDGPDEPTGLLALLYTAAWSYAELRGRLMQYEDTGLTPEEINDLASVREISPEAEYAINKHADSIIERLDKLLAQTDDDARLRELARADKDGRLVVLPCQSGEHVFALLDNQTHVWECEVEHAVLDGWRKVFAIRPLGHSKESYYAPFGAFGQSVFLTREEAEEALRRAGNG